jgi:hypothetical protein
MILLRRFSMTGRMATVPLILLVLLVVRVVALPVVVLQVAEAKMEE